MSSSSGQSLHLPRVGNERVKEEKEDVQVEYSSRAKCKMRECPFHVTNVHESLNCILFEETTRQKLMRERKKSSILTYSLSKYKVSLLTYSLPQSMEVSPNTHE